MASDTALVNQLGYAVQLGLGVVFLMAAGPKLRHPAKFARTVAGYRILPRRLIPAVAAGLIAVESLLAIMFLSGWMTGIALPLAAFILLAFAAGVAINLRRGQRIDCGCFGSGEEPISARSLVRLSALLFAVLLLAVIPASHITVATLAEQGLSAVTYLVQVGGLTCFLLLAAAWMLNLPEVSFVLRHLRRNRSGAE